MFQFHLKWTLDLSTGRRIIFDTKVLETWNLGKLAEKAINQLEGFVPYHNHTIYLLSKICIFVVI